MTRQRRNSSMNQRSYQHGFSALSTSMFDEPKRLRKAETMEAVLRDHYRDRSLNELDVLDIGASTGIISHHLAQFFHSVTGIDIDAAAIAYATQHYQRNNLKFQCDDAMQLSFEANRFDVVICAQIYEHVPCAIRMMAEIERVLKPGGICYFSAGNRLRWREPHYKLPLLSVIPKPLADRYMRLAGKGDEYYELHRTYGGLKRLTDAFHRIDYTARMIRQPEHFKIAYMVAPGSRKQKLALCLLRYAYWLFPNYVWLLQKLKAGAPV